MWNNKKPKRLFHVKLTNPLILKLDFNLDFQKVDQYTRSKWLIHSTKRRKANPLQGLELPYRISL